MRILVATGHLGVVGGTENYLRGVLPALRDKGHELALHYTFPAGPGRETIHQACPDVPAWPADFPASIDRALAWRPDVCYSQGMATPEEEERLIAHVPMVIFAHGYVATCASGIKCHAWPREEPCARRFGPACLPLNYLRQCGVRSPLRLLQNYRSQRRRERLLRKAAAVLVASRHMAAEVRRQDVPEDRVILAPLFPTALTPLPQPPARRAVTGKVLMCGRFTRIKGGHLLIEAASLASARLGRRLTLLFAGDGPEEAHWRALAARLDVEACFLGWCDVGRLDELRAEADLIAVPSVWPEPFGLVGVEAGCYGLPAVGFAVGGIPDWLMPGESGESAPSPPTAEGLADALTRALIDPDHHHRLRVGAWEMSRRFTREKHCEILHRVLEGTIAEATA